MQDCSSLRFLTGDANPPLVDDFINAQHEYNNQFAAHINDQSIHRLQDDNQQSSTTLWSSEKTAAEIENAGFDQDLTHLMTLNSKLLQRIKLCTKKQD